MQTLTSAPESPQPKLRPPGPKAFSTRSDASVRDSVRVLAEVVMQLSERIELLEARDLLSRAR
jgi:hypothetical protein